MTNTKRLRAKKILDMLTQVILDEDRYDDNSVEVIALSNSLDKVKVNKGHLFPSDGILLLNIILHRKTPANKCQVLQRTTRKNYLLI